MQCVYIKAHVCGYGDEVVKRTRVVPAFAICTVKVLCSMHTHTHCVDVRVLAPFFLCLYILKIFCVRCLTSLIHIIYPPIAMKMEHINTSTTTCTPIFRTIQIYLCVYKCDWLYMKRMHLLLLAGMAGAWLWACNAHQKIYCAWTCLCMRVYYIHSYIVDSQRAIHF